MNIKKVEPPGNLRYRISNFLVLISCLESHVEPIVWLPSNFVDLKTHYLGWKLC